MGARSAAHDVLEQAVASGLRMQLAWGAPLALVESGGLQVHVVEEADGHHWRVEWANRFDRPLAQGCRSRPLEAVRAAAAGLTRCLHELQSGAPEPTARRVRRLPLPSWHTTHDTPDKCSPESLDDVGRVLLSLISKPNFLAN